MKRDTFESSLLKFNARVLDQGTPKAGKTYTMKNLKEMMFYNRIFIWNTDEIFGRYETKGIIDQYVDLLMQYINNLNQIKKMASGIIEWNDDLCFESRWLLRQNMTGITNIHDASIENCHYKFEEGIYFIGVTIDGGIRIVTHDTASDIWRVPMAIDNRFWKLDEVLRKSMESRAAIVAAVVIKVTNNNGHTSKVEYHGNSDVMRYIAPLFGRQALIVNNPYLYTDDINMMISKYVKEEKEVQKVTNMNLLELLNKDRLLEYPYDSFGDYLSFLRSAVDNDETEELYITLYRIGSDPTLYNILRDAVNKGIKVYANVELNARGEKINKFWADELEAIGVRVSNFGSNKIKVHSKLTLIKFHNGKYVCQIGTGNYHTKTTSEYTDLSLMTGDDDICRQVKALFRLFRKGSSDFEFNDDMLVTLFNARQKLYDLIDSEGNKGENGSIIIKCNALDDNDILYHLDNAAKMGCKINLIIRGACTWIPEYDNVTVKSIVWNKLEHSRIFAFGKKNPVIYMGSLDLVTHKLDGRIETMVRIKNPDMLIKASKYLNRYITTDNYWVMNSRGVYEKR